MKYQQILDNNDMCKEINEEKPSNGKPMPWIISPWTSAVRIEKRATTAVQILPKHYLYKQRFYILNIIINN